MGAALFWIFTLGGASFAVVAALAWFGAAIIDRRSERLVLLLAEISAVGAAVAQCHPTTVPVVNVLFSAAIGGVVVVAASRCLPWVLVVCASIVGVAGLLPFHPPVLGPALGLAAAATAIAVVAAGVRAPVVRGMGGALLVQAALRLPWPSVQGGSALVAFGALLPVLAVGWFRSPRRYRRVGRWTVMVVAVVWLVGVAVSVLAGLAARHEIRQGVDEAEAALDSLRKGNQQEAQGHLKAAESALRQVHSSLGSWWASPGLAVPVVSQHLGAGRDVVEQARRLVAAAIEANDTANPRDLRLSGASFNVDKIRSFEGPLGRTVDAVRATRNAVTHASSAWLVTALSDRLDQLSAKLKTAERDSVNALDVVRIAPAMLGADKEQFYFLALMTPAELRGSVGVTGSYAELGATNGKLDLIRVGRDTELNNMGAHPKVLTTTPEFDARYSAFRGEDAWQNINFSPDWPTVADLMNQAYPQSGGHAVDGVIGMDPAALAGLLKLSGPITAPGWDGEINASNVEQIMYVDQYAAFGDRSGRVSFLGGVTKVIWDRLRTVSPSPIDMAKVLGPLAHNGHIKIWAADTKRESLFDRLSLSGAVAPIDGDYLAVVNANVGGNKMDAYLQREVTYDVSWDPATGTISADLTIKLNNNAPASGLPLYVTAKTDGTTEIAGENRMFVTVYTPWKVTSSKLDGVDFGANQQTEFGRTAISYYLTVLPSRSKVLHLTMTGSLAGQYRLDLHHQVTVHPDANSVNVHVPSGWVAHSVGLSTQGTAATATLVGNKDYRLSITASEPANSPGPWHKFREGRW